MLKKYLKEVGKICAEARKKVRITQSAIAKTVGVTEVAICHFEHGREDSARILIAYLWFNIVNIDELPLYENYVAIHNGETNDYNI